MANVRGKSIDATHLSIDTAEDRFIQHRDYVAHCLRWAAVVRRMGRNNSYKKARVLDVGCGVDTPMARMLYSNKMVPESYVGVDYNSPEKIARSLEFFRPKRGGEGKFPIRVFGGVDFADDGQVDVIVPNSDDPELHILGNEVGFPNVVTCFEVLEHVEPEHAVRMLRKVRGILSVFDGVFYMSTPCYDRGVGAAGNHVNEMTRGALGSVLENLGFAVVENYGTFASQRDYRDHLFAEYPGLLKAYDRLSEYYDSNLIANMWAPLVPQHSRNNFWTLRVAGPSYERKFAPLSEVAEPWSSSEHWRDLDQSEEKAVV